MDDEEKEIIGSVFNSVRPYLANPDKTKEIIEKISDESSGLKEFRKKLDSKVSAEKDPTTGADFRIFINKLKNR